MTRTLPLLLPLGALACGESKRDLPNFVVIVSDDQGYADVGVFGSGTAPDEAPWNEWDRIPIPTPRIDQLAAEGMRMTAFYTGHHRCTPSRASLLTGAYPSRVGFGQVVLFPDDEKGLNPNEVTVAEMLRARGYATGMFGKWHLGHQEPFLPLQQGFDVFYGVPYSHNLWLDPFIPFASDAEFRGDWSRERVMGLRERPDQWQATTNLKTPLMRGNEVIEFPLDVATFTERITDEAIAFVQQHRDEPFFLYVPHAMPHVPLEVTPAFRGFTDRGSYGNVVAEMDFHIGRLVDAIDEAGLSERTLVLFTSDNGPWRSQGERAGTAYPFAGGKSSYLEGGFRVPTVVRWPGRVPAGTTQPNMASFIDVYPTLAALSGGGLPRDRVFDGTDITAMFENPAAPSPHELLFYNVSAVRRGPWKWVENQLFHLENDPGETTDLTKQEPELAAELKGLVEAHRVDQEENQRRVGTLETTPREMGCTDPEARNYDDDAEIDDGSCRY